MEKKYELVMNNLITLNRRTLFRIKALRDIPEFNVKKGDLGGFVESEANLSHSGNAWVRDSAKIMGNAFVFGNALVCHNAVVHCSALVYDSAIVYQNAIVSDFARVGDDSLVGKNARIRDNALVYGNAQVLGNMYLYVITPVSVEMRLLKMMLLLVVELLL